MNSYIARIALTSVCAAVGASAQAEPSFTHIVVVFQENRTPDNIFGSNPSFEPGVDIATSGQNSLGQTIALTPETIASCYDIGHSNMSFNLMYDGGKLPGRRGWHRSSTPSVPNRRAPTATITGIQPQF